MSSRRLEVADVIRQHGADYQRRYGGSTSPAQRRVLKALAACRTAALGGHVEACDRCGHRRIAYNSCRDRHCPKCQALARARWLEARTRELLPVPYVHLVFTLPSPLHPIALQNPRLLYDLLFRAAAHTLLTVAARPHPLGAQIGFLAILHTWGQNLHHHPHLHCVAPAGGLSPDGTRWIPSRATFFLPVRLLSRVFRRTFLRLLTTAFENERLAFHGTLQPLADPSAFQAALQPLSQQEWVVYVKPPFGGPRQVLAYLARYTHRVAISNQRLVSLQDGHVTFRWKNYAQHSREDTLTLDAVEFLRRFLLHVLPTGFRHIRYFGLLANRDRREHLDRCRQLLGASEVPALTDSASTDLDPRRCPACRQGTLVLVEILAPSPLPFAEPHVADSS